MTNPRTFFLALLLFVAAALPLCIAPAGAQQTDRAKKIGAKLLCMCGCSQILTQCNHVGCTVSASMLKQLDQAVARGDSDDLLVQSFVQEFGMQVFAEPPKKGFNSIAWYIPGTALAAGLVLVVVVISRWARRPAAVTPTGTASISSEMLARARARADRETED